MVLKEGKRLDKAKRLIQSGQLAVSENMVWFASYLIHEYLDNKGLSVNYHFVPTVQYSEYSVDTLGIYRKDMWEEIFNINKRKSYLDPSINAEEFLWFMFNQLGHFLLNEEMSQKMMNNVYTFGNPVGYGEKLYKIYKESFVGSLISSYDEEKISDMWLSECEASIIGGSILLDIIGDNFADERSLFNIRGFIDWKIRYYTIVKYSVERINFENGVDCLIMKNADDVMDENTDLGVEFDVSGKKKNILQLLEYRERVKDNLEIQKEYYSDEKIKDKIGSILINNDELMEYLTYKAIRLFGDDSFVKVLSLVKEEDELFIKKAIENQLSKFKYILNVLEDYVEDGDHSLDSSIDFWKEESMNALRLLNLIKNNNMILKKD